MSLDKAVKEFYAEKQAREKKLSQLKAEVSENRDKLERLNKEYSQTYNDDLLPEITKAEGIIKDSSKKAAIIEDNPNGKLNELAQAVYEATEQDKERIKAERSKLYHEAKETLKQAEIKYNELMKQRDTVKYEWWESGPQQYGKDVCQYLKDEKESQKLRLLAENGTI